MDCVLELHDNQPQGFRPADYSRVVHYKFDLVAKKWPVMKAVLYQRSYTFWVPVPTDNQGEGRGNDKVFIPSKETGILTDRWTIIHYQRYLTANCEFFDVSPRGSRPHIVGYKIRQAFAPAQATPMTTSAKTSPPSSVRKAQRSPATSVKNGSRC